MLLMQVRKIEFQVVVCKITLGLFYDALLLIVHKNMFFERNALKGEFVQYYIFPFRPKVAWTIFQHAV